MCWQIDKNAYDIRNDKNSVIILANIKFLKPRKDMEDIVVS